jgi:tyrosyl-DNA phosphodiesterase 2
VKNRFQALAIKRNLYRYIKEPLKEVRLLTYNVWFAEHVALVDRVQGMSDVVMDTDPHVICLQEVTPNILMLLHAMPWFEDYKGTPPPAQKYFTLVLFKRSMDKPDKTTRLVRRQFEKSIMVGLYKSESGLLVASNHLVSTLEPIK